MTDDYFSFHIAFCSNEIVCFYFFFALIVMTPARLEPERIRVQLHRVVRKGNLSLTIDKNVNKIND